LAATGLPTRLANVGLAGATERLLTHLLKDKKISDGKTTLILPRRIADAFVMSDAPAGTARSTILPFRRRPRRAVAPGVGCRRNVAAQPIRTNLSMLRSWVRPA
jgi:hypothetical protein